VPRKTPQFFRTIGHSGRRENSRLRAWIGYGTGEFADRSPTYNESFAGVSAIRLAVAWPPNSESQYHWHKHDDDDEFFYVVEGKLLIDFEERTVELPPRQGLVVPKGVLHRTRAAERRVMLMVETAGIVPTGD
jgi:mannose-6-phosphate isomerase-like protein (cupin superfamily)